MAIRPSLLIGRRKAEEKPKNDPEVLPQTGDFASEIFWRAVGIHSSSTALVTIEKTHGSRKRLQMTEVVESQGLVGIKVLKLRPEAQVPRYAHTGVFGDLAADLYA